MLATRGSPQALIHILSQFFHSSEENLNCFLPFTHELCTLGGTASQELEKTQLKLYIPPLIEKINAGTSACEFFLFNSHTSTFKQAGGKMCLAVTK